MRQDQSLRRRFFRYLIASVVLSGLGACGYKFVDEI